jgi:cytochrome c biogenesis protein CcdA
MFLVLAAYLGGVLTILSPCILPVLPFVFARSDQPFTRSGLPILLGMAITFAVVASLATVGGGWIVEANYYGRIAAILLMALFGITLLHRFHARDVHLVPGPAPDGNPVKFQVLIDGHAPGTDHGVDIDADGNGVIKGQRLYQLVRLAGNVSNHTFEIRFLAPGATAYSFTFG